MNYNLKEEPLVISKPTLDRILKSDHPDAIALYVFYYYTAKWQGTNYAKCTSSYVMKGLKIGKVKFLNWKRVLLGLKLIEDIIAKNEKGQIQGNYIKVNFIHYNKSTGSENHWAENPPVDNDTTNALSTNSINALITNRENKTVVSINRKKHDLLQQPKSVSYSNKFEDFWKLYPKKTGKKFAYTCYQKARMSNDILLPAVKEQIRSKQWQRGYVPNPSTWLNQGRWDDEVMEEKSEVRIAMEETMEWMPPGEV